MPIRRVGSFGGARGGGPAGGGSVELASAYVSIMPETSKLAPGVRKAAQATARELDQNISQAMQTAFKRSETYATAFGQHVASSNVGMMRSFDRVVNSAQDLGKEYQNLNKVLNNKKSTLNQVEAAMQSYDRKLRAHSTNVEDLGAKTAAFNRKQQEFSNQRAQAASREAAEEQRRYDRNMRAAQQYTSAQAAFTKQSKARVEADAEAEARRMNKAFDQQTFRNSLVGRATMFKRHQSEMRDELAATAQFGERRWQRMSAAMALSNMNTSRSFRDSMSSALSQINTQAGHVSRGIRTGLMRSAGVPMAVAGAAGLGVMGGAGIKGGLDRVLSGGMQRIQTIQNAQVSMQAIMGNAQQANDMVNRVVTMAQGTPYGADMFLQMARNMVTMGVNAEQVVPSVEALANAAALMGKPASALDQLSREFGKIKAEGRLMGRDVYELQRVGGINAREIIANSLGITGAELTERMGKKGGLKVDADQIIQTLVTGIMHGSTGAAGTTPAYGGGLEVMRHTLSGSIQVMKSQLDRMGAALLGGADPTHPTGFLAAIPSMLDKITHGPNGLSAMSDPGGPLDRLQQKLQGAGVGHMFVSMFERLPGLIGSVADGIGRITEALHSDTARTFFHVIGDDVSSIWKTVQSLLPNIAKFGGAIAAGFGGVAMTGLTLFKDTLNALAPVIRVVTGFLGDNKIVVEGLIGLYAALAIKNKAVEIGMSGISRVMGFMNQTTMDSKTGLTTTTNLWQRMGGAFSKARGEAEGLGGVLRGSLAAGASGAKEAIGGLMGAFGGPWGIAAMGVTAGVGIISAKYEQLRADAEQLRAKEKALQDQLDATTGAITEAARTQVAEHFQKLGIPDKAAAAGLDPHDVLLATTGDKGAEQRLADKIAMDKRLAASGDQAAQERVRAAQAVVDAMGGESAMVAAAAKAQQQLNQQLRGSWEATQPLIDKMHELGATIVAVPTKEDIVVHADTDAARDRIQALQDQGYKVERDLNDPNKFHITANTDEAKLALAALIRQVESNQPVIKPTLDPNATNAVIDQWKAAIQGLPAPNITPPGPPAPGAPPGPPTLPQIILPHSAQGGRFATGGFILGTGNRIHNVLNKTPKVSFAGGGWMQGNVSPPGGPGGAGAGPNGGTPQWWHGGALGDMPWWWIISQWGGQMGPFSHLPGIGDAPGIGADPGDPFVPMYPSHAPGQGGVGGFAAGARMIHGPGTGRSDSIPGFVDGVRPIAVSNGESINTAASTSRNWPAIRAMNAGATLPTPLLRHMGVPGFDEGGAVNPPSKWGGILGHAGSDIWDWTKKGWHWGEQFASKPIMGQTKGQALQDAPKGSIARSMLGMLLRGTPKFATGGIAGSTPSADDPGHGAIPGAPSGAGEDIVSWLGAILQQYNAQFGTNLAISADFPGGPHGHPDDGGQHSAGHAVDISGDPKQMAQFANWWTSNPGLVQITRQLIHSNAGFDPNMNIIGGHYTSGPGTYGKDYPQHGAHIHLAVQYIPGQGQGANPNQMMGGGDSHMRALEHQYQTAQRQLEASQHDIEIAKQHIEDLKTHKKPAPQAEVDRANETLRRAEERHDTAQARMTDLQGQMEAERANPRGGRGGRGAGAGGAGGEGGDAKDLGKLFTEGILQSFGFDGSVFSDPRQWAGVKSIAALVNWFTKPVDKQSMAGLAAADPGYGKNLINPMFGKGGGTGKDSIVDTIVSTGMQHGASQSMLQAALMAGLDESSLDPKATNGPHMGIFQMDNAKGTEAQRRDPNFAANWWFRIAQGIPGAATMDPATLAMLVENPGPGEANYGKFGGQAKDLLQAALGRAGGGGGGGGLNLYNAAPPGGGGNNMLSGLLNILPGITNRRAGGGGGGGIPDLETYTSGGGGGGGGGGDVGGDVGGDTDLGDDGGGYDAAPVAYNDGLRAGGNVHSVGNVTFNLAPGATLGWDPAAAQSKMQQHADMGARRYQDRTVLL
jgi:hypothetical protein